MSADRPADLKALTSLRFIAALWVVLYHYWPRLSTEAPPAPIGQGYLGVEVFFVLSGFIISHVYLQAAGEGRMSYRSFLWARIARLYPLHLATLIGVGLMAMAATLAGFSVSDSIMNWAALPANLLMVHAWGLAPASSWNHPSWSISAEWFAYLAFPAFAWVAWRLRRKPGLAVAGAAGLIVAIYPLFEHFAGFSLTRATFQWGALRIVPCFAYGCALYLLHRQGLRRPGRVALLGFAALVASAVLPFWDGFTVLAAGLMILGLGGLSDRQAGIMASRPAVYLGEISYSVYMVCIPWALAAFTLAGRLAGTGDGPVPWPLWLAVLLTVPVAAAVTHHLIERPGRRLLRGLDPRLDGKAAAPARAVPEMGPR